MLGRRSELLSEDDDDAIRLGAVIDIDLHPDAAIGRCPAAVLVTDDALDGDLLGGDMEVAIEGLHRGDVDGAGLGRVDDNEGGRAVNASACPDGDARVRGCDYAFPPCRGHVR